MVIPSGPWSEVKLVGRSPSFPRPHSSLLSGYAAGVGSLGTSSPQITERLVSVSGPRRPCDVSLVGNS